MIFVVTIAALIAAILPTVLDLAINAGTNAWLIAACLGGAFQAGVVVKKQLDDAISNFGVQAKAKLKNIAIAGAPEDQLRNPLETLIEELAGVSGIPANSVGLVGETTLAGLQIRPDFAVTVNKQLVGFIEVKRPGKGADPRKFNDPHDKAQAKKLQSLPNLLYTDGNSFSLWRSGELQGKVVELEGDVETSGAKLSAPEALLPLISDFLRWAPEAPRSPQQLALICAKLCRLLRDEVEERMTEGNTGLSLLAADWKKLLFPNATNERFADGYAQAVTFGLLVARAHNIPLDKGLGVAALELRKTNSLIGTALRLLTDDPANHEALKTSLDTLTRVLNVVDWNTISKGKPEAWLTFYEDFLQVYDNALRKQTGSYYTPPEVVDAMVRLVDEALKMPTLFKRSLGIAAPDVTIADPAVGTGTFLLGVLRKIAENVKSSQGEGAVSSNIKSAADRLFGFELQFGPFAVAQLRLLAEVRALMHPDEDKVQDQADGRPPPTIPDLHLFVTDTLSNPFIEEEGFSSMEAAIAQSRRDANRIKRDQSITVVIGNPPYKEKAEGRGGWIEAGSGGRHIAPLDRWKAPKSWGVGTHGKHLKNLYIYFWRWAALKVFGAGLHEATDLPEIDEEGIVCFITVSGFLNGRGFERMRDDLRRTCSSIWIVHCSPEGHQPQVSSRIFQGVQHEICIVLALRKRGKSSLKAAQILFTSLSAGDRFTKFAELSELSLTSSNWETCSSSWRAPFLPSAIGLWSELPYLESLFDFSNPGVMPGRTWVITPDKETLIRRWQALRAEKDKSSKEKLFHPQLRKGKLASRHINKVVKEDLGVFKTRKLTLDQDQGDLANVVRYAFRSFDRQWIVADARFLNDPRAKLWETLSTEQLYLTALAASSPSGGPSISFTELIVDQDHYKGSFGGRVLPLWRDAAATVSNFYAGLLPRLAEDLGPQVSPESVYAYIAAVLAHPAYTARFQKDLKRPGLRVPITADATLFAEAVALGREVIWLHCYGERFHDEAAGRPQAPPRLPPDRAPTIPKAGAIPPEPEELPETMDYDADLRRLRVGKGYVDNVSPAMWAYEVSGKQVLRQWFSYRKRDRTRPQIGDKRAPSPLMQIQPKGWLAEYTTDLLDLLNVLGRLVELEPRQAAILERICEGPLITHDVLLEAGVIAPDPDANVEEDAAD